MFSLSHLLSIITQPTPDDDAYQLQAMLLPDWFLQWESILFAVLIALPRTYLQVINVARRHDFPLRQTRCCFAYHHQWVPCSFVFACPNCRVGGFKFATKKKYIGSLNLTLKKIYFSKAQCDLLKRELKSEQQLLCCPCASGKRSWIKYQSTPATYPNEVSKAFAAAAGWFFQKAARSQIACTALLIF